MADLAEVWDPLSFMAGLVWGLIFGYVINALTRRPRFEPKIEQSITLIVWLTTLLVAVLFIGQTMFQAVAELLNGDPNWVRILSRGFGPNVMCALGVGLGGGVAEWQRRRRRK